MHSSGMRTARLLTVSQHALSAQGGCLPREGVSARGVSASDPGGGECIPACNGADTPRGQTDTCENITFANLTVINTQELKFFCMRYSQQTFKKSNLSYSKNSFYGKASTFIQNLLFHHTGAACKSHANPMQ